MQPGRGLVSGRCVGAWTHAPAHDTVAWGGGLQYTLSATYACSTLLQPPLPLAGCSRPG